MNLFIISIITFFINIPFGYWRANVNKFTLQWMLAIHIPVPVVVFMRIYTDVGFGWKTYIFLVFAFFIGQKTGAVIQKILKKNNKTSSCLFMDLGKLLSK